MFLKGIKKDSDQIVLVIIVSLFRISRKLVTAKGGNNFKSLYKMQIKNYPEQKDIQRAAMEDACLSYQLYPDLISVQEKEKGIGLIDL